jgi:large subunit ribosomal protein L9
MTQVVLTQDIYKLGTVGELVTVKPGYARNYLIPKGYALRATKQNLEFFETRKGELQEIARKNKEAAVALSLQIDGKTYSYIAAASERNMLYGAITPTVITQLLETHGITVSKNAVQIAKPIKTLGLHAIRIALHNEVMAVITLNVARNEDESQRNLRANTDAVASDDLDALNIAPSKDEDDNDNDNDDDNIA